MVDDNTVMAMADDSGVIQGLALFTRYGAFYRDEHDWVPAAETYDEDTDPIDDLEPHNVGLDFVPLFDMAEETDATLTVHDITT